MEQPDDDLRFFKEEEEFFVLLQHFLDQIDVLDHSSPDLKLAIPEVYSGNLSGYLMCILDRYQEQPYLLDPHLERMVLPLVQSLRRWMEYLQHSQARLELPSTETEINLKLEDIIIRFEKLSHLLYFLTKVRGRKTIIRFFPHEVQDLSIVLATFSLFRGSLSESSRIASMFSDPQAWRFRYILLLWLSLICMIPFDLSRFDQLLSHCTQGIQTSDHIENIAWSFLSSPGSEREAGALVLGRLILRQDVAPLRLKLFVERCIDQLQQAKEYDIFLATGILEVLCILVKLAQSTQIISMLHSFHEILSLIDRLPYITRSINLRKLRTKLAGRIALMSPLIALELSLNNNEKDLPGIEATIDDLLQCLQDKDTVVRWSAAKYLARIAKCLPDSLSEEVCDAILQLYDAQPRKEQNKKLDSGGVSEHIWHGACLACAEFLQSKIFPLSRLETLIKWAVQALHFEQRRGIQNIGSGVRDAAAYVLWCFGRAFSSNDLEPHAHQLATQLVLQSLFDREVHIRRAGSAAFQENVGRLGIFPHGIDVLQLADYFTVGLRRSAFLNAAPQIARFQEYHDAILNHLLTVSLPHWDTGIRELASQSICEIARATSTDLPSSLLDRFAIDLQSKDINQAHGTLLAIGGLAKLLHENFSHGNTREVLEKMLDLIKSIPAEYLKPYKSQPLLPAVFQALAYTIPTDPCNCQRFIEASFWKETLLSGLKQPDDNLHRSIQLIFYRLSTYGIGEQELISFVNNLRTASAVTRQASARCLGGFVFGSESLRKHFTPTFEALIYCTQQNNSNSIMVIEVTRNALESLVSIVINSGSQAEQVCSPKQFLRLMTALVEGLANYTTDQRGDVGSWVRTSSLTGLAELLEYCAQSSSRVHNYLDQTLLQSIIASVLKQTLDSIDSVRELAWKIMSRIVMAASTFISLQIKIEGFNSLTQAFDQKYSQQWRQLSWTFAELLKLLDLFSIETTSHSMLQTDPRGVHRYYVSILEGIVLLIGGQGNSETKKAARILCEHMRNSSLQSKPTVEDTVSGIIYLAKTGRKGTKKVLHYWKTLSLLLEADALEHLGDSESGVKLLTSMLAMVTHGLGKPKFPLSQVLTGMKIVVHLTRFEPTRMDSLNRLPIYLSHDSPRVRMLTAEAIYNELQLQAQEAPEAQRLLSETEWSDCTGAEALKITTQIIKSLQDMQTIYHSVTPSLEKTL
ncbi:hypothetical protein O181_019340 [Austropuccinia psidii MF-1]|uniref:Tubulin-specific chaperone D n=1 Tax=Austropuccinia psidii MF-1 TaxID=1389203 RepID=A0A9Q3CBL2_9BASI|nr:hypothetical protein [Austropuccinia psidii MF-1]